jgi:hypothetical protein
MKAIGKLRDARFSTASGLNLYKAICTGAVEDDGRLIPSNVREGTPMGSLVSGPPDTVRITTRWLTTLRLGSLKPTINHHGMASSKGTLPAKEFIVTLETLSTNMWCTCSNLNCHPAVFERSWSVYLPLPSMSSRCIKPELNLTSPGQGCWGIVAV